MTIPIIKIKIFRKSVVKARMDVRFPANVAAANFLTVTRANGTYTFAVDYSVLTPGPILDSTTSYIAISDTTAGIYRTVTLASLLASGLDADLQAIAALAGTGVLVRTAANTWALRTLAGTANEITVTNGDGVSGAPTLSLPAALTFTGKTVTGGTFSSPALVTPALGTPASGVATNLTGTASGLTAGHVTTNANLTGPVTSVGNATSVTANAITNAMCAQMGAYTLKGNATGVTANEADIDVTALTSKPSPISADIVLIQDSAASNAFKKTTVGALASAGSVGSYNGRTGAVTATTTDVPLPNYLTGLTLSTAGSTATFGIATGFATDSTNASMMALGSAYTKTTAAWVVGTGNGSFDGTGSAPSATAAWYHVHLIKRPDTGVVDILTSNSATAPTLPTNYTLFRRIGAMKTNGSFQWIKFVQDGDVFQWDVPVVDVNAVNNPGTAAVTRTLTVPTGVRVQAMISAAAQTNSTAGTPGAFYISDLSVADTAASNSAFTVYTYSGTTQTLVSGAQGCVFTNNTAQVRTRIATSNTDAFIYINTNGWRDRRGRDG